MKTKQKKGLWVSHGQTIHPFSERKRCKFCRRVELEFKKNFLDIFGKDPKGWPFPLCLDTKKIMDKLRTKAEGKVKATCLFKNMITGKPLSDSCPIRQKYAKKGKK